MDGNSTIDRKLGLSRAWRALALLFAACFVAACGYPQIRVKNDSPYRLDDIRVHSGEMVRDFGSLSPGDATAYTTVGEATEWERVEARLSDGGEALFEPQAHANPGSLGPGFWTYHLRVEPAKDGTTRHRLKLFLTKDAYPPDV